MSSDVRHYHSPRTRQVNARVAPYSTELEALHTATDMATETVSGSHPSWRYEAHPEMDDHTVVHLVLMSEVRGRQASEDIAVVHLPDHMVSITEEQAHYHAALVDTLEWMRFDIKLVQ